MTFAISELIWYCQTNTVTVAFSGSFGILWIPYLWSGGYGAKFVTMCWETTSWKLRNQSSSVRWVLVISQEVSDNTTAQCAQSSTLWRMSSLLPYTVAFPRVCLCRLPGRAGLSLCLVCSCSSQAKPEETTPTRWDNQKYIKHWGEMSMCLNSEASD